MKADRNKEIIELRRSGMAQTKIGKMYGISRQRVDQICKGTKPITKHDPCHSGKTARALRLECVFPNIRRFMIDNKLVESTFGELLGLSQNTVSTWLTGKAAPRKDTIDKILEITNMTYEEAFRRAE